MGFKPGGLVRLNKKEFGAVLAIPLAAVERSIALVTSQITNSLNKPFFMTKLFHLELDSLNCMLHSESKR